MTEKQEKLSISTEAAKKMLDIVKAEEKQFLRIFLAGMSCGGPRYGFKFAESKEEVDTLLEIDADTEKLQILIDPASMAYLEGSEITCIKTDQGEQLTIKNPKQEGGCGGGCGGCSGC
jgi:iron-sulfur cluster assembly accessory protein